MVSYGAKKGERYDLYNMHDAIFIAERNGFPKPTEEDALKYGPLGAVAKMASDRLDIKKPESVRDYARRTLDTYFRGWIPPEFREGFQPKSKLLKILSFLKFSKSS